MAGPIRWGIASAGNISSDFVNAVQMLGSKKHLVVAVAARSKDSAEKFAKKFGIPKAYDSYEKLGQDSEIDIVYVGAINSSHSPITKMILNAGKPVLCEKPICVDVAQTKELLEVAKQKNVFLMEAMWSRCLPAYKELKTRIQNEEIGPVVNASVSFGIQIAAIPRVYRRELGESCLLDIGIYAVNFLMLVMGDEKPLEIQAMGKLNDDGIEVEVSGTMRFSNNRLGTFQLSTSTDLPNEASVSGSKGTLTLKAPFWSTTTVTGPPRNFEAPLEKTDRDFIYPNGQNLKYEAEEVARCLREGLKECPLVPHSLTETFAEVIEQIRRQVGVQY